MLEFLLALLTTVTVGVLLVPLLRRRHATTDRLDHELALYRDQLAEVERERAAGSLPEADAQAARTEIERRVLAASDRAGADRAGQPNGAEFPPWHRYLVPALAIAVPLVSLGFYLQSGRPGLPSAPFEPGAIRSPHGPVNPQQRIEQVIAQMRQRLAEKPDDAEALSILGEALTLEAQGTVTRPAREALDRALRLNPNDPRTIYYIGLAEAQAGDSRAALTRWLELEAMAPPNAPWLATLRAEIERVARQANIDPLEIRRQRPPVAPPSAMPTPTREQMEAMQNLTPEQRQLAIRGMVEGLEQRLRQNPQDRAGWLRLANAWRVLGENAKAGEAFARADALGALDAGMLADWAESLVRLIPPGEPPKAATIKVLERLERAEPRNGLALFYLGAAYAAAGDKQEALKRWRTLLAMLPADAPVRGVLERRIKELE
jgi:cytochrome c-type biogenesis protein CcmH